MSTWSITELQQRVEEALHVVPAVAAGRRVKAPNQRTIRYYATQGLVDKPDLEGGQARYQRRQLLQILAVKRLQAKGWSLAEVHEQLDGASNRSLAKYAKVPSEEALAKARTELNRLRAAFWLAKQAKPHLAACYTTLRGLELAPGVILTFKVVRDLYPQDVQELTDAAQPLLDSFRDRGLLP
jgi:DNA-binding transcriptional MerR regulator